MTFSGKWELESQQGYDEFCKLIGLPTDVIERGRDYKMVTEVGQNGDDFTWTQHYPANHSLTNKFIIGKECDMETIAGKKFKATVTLEGGKLTTRFPNYLHIVEVSGGKLIETSTTNSAKGQVIFIRTSKKI